MMEVKYLRAPLNNLFFSLNSLQKIKIKKIDLRQEFFFILDLIKKSLKLKNVICNGVYVIRNRLR